MHEFQQNNRGNIDQGFNNTFKENAYEKFSIDYRDPNGNLDRAIDFYKKILTVNIEEAAMGDLKMGVLPSEEGTVNVVLVNGPDYKPTSTGNVIYLNGGDDLQVILDKVEAAGGKMIVPKTEISSEIGFFALFVDTEGNKLGLHSKK